MNNPPMTATECNGKAPKWYTESMTVHNSETTEAESGNKDYDDVHYDSPEEEAIDWYQHYMSVPAESLAAQYLSSQLRDERETSVALQMAAEARVEEIEAKITGEFFEGFE